MSRSPTPEAGSGQDAAAALELLGQARRALADERIEDAAKLVAMLEPLQRALAAPSALARPREELLAILDEAAALASALQAARERLQARLRATGTQRRAGAAYHRAGQL